MLTGPSLLEIKKILATFSPSGMRVEKTDEKTTLHELLLYSFGGHRVSIVGQPSCGFSFLLCFKGFMGSLYLATLQ